VYERCRCAQSGEHGEAAEGMEGETEEEGIVAARVFRRPTAVICIHVVRATHRFIA